MADKFFIKALIFVQDILGPLIWLTTFTMTYILDLLKETESMWVDIGIFTLGISMAAFYIARFRKIWKEGTQIHQQNQKKREK